MTATVDTLPNLARILPGRLTLPMPDRAFSPCDRVRHLTSSAPAFVDLTGAGTRAWYRWILGHHLSFCVWRLMAEALAAAARGSERALDVTARLYDSYSALLLYAGSCTPHVYDSQIRARMKACSPAFSGMWARDYREVLDRLATVAPAAGSPLKRALKFNRLVHMSTATRLVPGPSLLRESGHDTHAQPTESECDLLDSFFLTDRAATCEHTFVAQLKLRTTMALGDLDRHRVDVHYDRAEVNDFQRRITAHLRAPEQLAEQVLAEGTGRLD
jgi:hypothetical protein